MIGDICPICGKREWSHGATEFEICNHMKIELGDGSCFNDFHLDWLLDETDTISNLEYDEYFYDANDRVSLR